jgi:Stringent starvation protein B
MSDGPLPYKRDVANMLLRKGSLFIHLDPRVTEVMVPPWLRHQAQLVLQVGFEMPIPILDLRVDEDGVFGTLSFSRTPFACSVPWSAVFALVGDEGRGMVWPDSMPAEIVAEVEREAMRAKVSADNADTSIPTLRPRDTDVEVLRWPAKPGSPDSRLGKRGKEPEVAILRAAEPDGRPRRESSRPPPSSRSSTRRGVKSLPPYLRVVK